MLAAFWAGRHWNGREVVNVEVAAPLAAKQQLRPVAVLDPVERVEHAGLQRHRSHARFGLWDLQLAAGE